MTTFTALYSAANSISRKWFNSTTVNAATIYDLVVPVGATCCIMSGVGAGGWKTNSDVPGGGSAFAKEKLTNLVAGEHFSIQVGSTKHSLDAGDSQGDSIITRVTGSVIVLKAARGTGVVANLPGAVPPIVNGGTPGLAADCIGTIKRDGAYGNSSGYYGGFSGSDLSDTYSLGFGGRGVKHGRFPAAGPGGGGINRILYDSVSYKAYYPGAGKICVEFFTKDPGYI